MLRNEFNVFLFRLTGGWHRLCNGEKKGLRVELPPYGYGLFQRSPARQSSEAAFETFERAVHLFMITEQTRQQVYIVQFHSEKIYKIFIFER